MILYSIRRLSDGLFFVHTDGHGRLQMCQSPTFWKKRDSVWLNLKRICSEFYYEEYKIREGGYIYRRKNWRNFNPQKLQEWEVIITDVKVLGERQIPAQEFVVPANLEEMDICIHG